MTARTLQPPTFEAHVKANPFKKAPHGEKRESKAAEKRESKAMQAKEAKGGFEKHGKMGKMAAPFGKKGK